MVVLIAQLECPLATEVESFLARTRRLRSATGFHLYNNGGGLHPVALGSLLQQELEKEVYLHLQPADRNRAALFSDLLTAYVTGLDKVVLGSGEHPIKTRFPEAKPVYDLDLLQLLRMTIKAREGFDPADRPLGEALALQVGVQVRVDSPLEFLRLRQMVEWGVDFVFLKWPSRFLDLFQLQIQIERPIYLSVELKQVRREEGDWQRIRDSGLAGINLVVPAGEEDRAEETFRWFSRYR